MRGRAGLARRLKQLEARVRALPPPPRFSGRRVVIEHDGDEWTTHVGERGLHLSVPDRFAHDPEGALTDEQRALLRPGDEIMIVALHPACDIDDYIASTAAHRAEEEARRARWRAAHGDAGAARA
jgi:hypothetical protein